MDNDIEEFLKVSHGNCHGYGHGEGSGDGGYGDGYGNGDGSGNGYGYGRGDGSGDGDGYDRGDGSGDDSGYGDGYGRGEGSGYGFGCGSGDGSGVAVFNGEKVWTVDGVPTLIRSIHRGYAKCAVLRSDLTLKACYVAKEGNCFAHGHTLRDAVMDARKKYLEDMPIEERIRMFVKEYPNASCVVQGTELYRWHGVLTGSCRMGRDEWCRSHGMKPEKTALTVRRFCELTANAYGGDVIRQLAKQLGIKMKKEAE